MYITTLLQIHGFGILIYRGLAKLEATNGGNFKLESVYACYKMKLSFGLSNHNHTDVDANVGTTGAAVTNHELYTDVHFEKICMKIFRMEGTKILAELKFAIVSD